MFAITPIKRSELDALYYEMLMLNAVPSIISKNGVQKDACIESFLIHARNLIDFLEDNKKFGDDLTCSYFDGLKGDKISIIPVNLPNDLKIRINKHLSHITLSRVNEKVIWDLFDIKTEINNSLVMFFDQLSPRYFPTAMNRELGDFISLLSKS